MASLRKFHISDKFSLHLKYNFGLAFTCKIPQQTPARKPLGVIAEPMLGATFRGFRRKICNHNLGQHIEDFVTVICIHKSFELAQKNDWQYKMFGSYAYSNRLYCQAFEWQSSGFLRTKSTDVEKKHTPDSLLSADSLQLSGCVDLIYICCKPKIDFANRWCWISAINFRFFSPFNGSWAQQLRCPANKARQLRPTAAWQN